MAIKLNLNRETNKDFEQIAAGEYEVKVANFEAKVVGDKKVISVDYEIRDDVDQNFKGQKIRFDDFFCTERALWKIENASIAAGFTEKEAEFEKYTEWATSYLNKFLRVEVKLQKANNGNEYPRVAKYLQSEATFEESDFDENDLPF